MVVANSTPSPAISRPPPAVSVTIGVPTQVPCLSIEHGNVLREMRVNRLGLYGVPITESFLEVLPVQQGNPGGDRGGAEERDARLVLNTPIDHHDPGRVRQLLRRLLLRDLCRPATQSHVLSSPVRRVSSASSNLHARCINFLEVID